MESIRTAALVLFGLTAIAGGIVLSNRAPGHIVCAVAGFTPACATQ